MNILEKLTNEIERVVILHTQYESMRCLPDVNVELMISMITLSLNRAKTALASDNIGEMIYCLDNLKGYTA